MGCAIRGRNRRWPNGVIPFVFDTGDFPAESNQRQIVQRAIDHWNTNSVINLIPHTDQKDWVRFVMGPKCQSRVGRRRGEQIISCAVGPFRGRGSVTHEIGHAVGLNHEHSRPDRNSFVSVPGNLTPKVDYERKKDSIALGEYDYGSIMHYGTETGLSTTQTIPPGVTVGQRRGLSLTDRQSVLQMYQPTWVISRDGTRRWEPINVSKIGPKHLMLADFTGNGLADVFRATGSQWNLSDDGVERLRRLNRSTLRLRDLAFGDFNGDGITDVFRANGTNWFVSSGGTGPWTRINRSAARVGSLLFGDFSGDGITDVFRANGTNWFISSGGTGSWTKINTSSLRVQDLRVGDFNGDGTSDIFRATGRKWQISRGGRGQWATINSSSFRVGDLRFADFNGDGQTDIFRTNGRHWFVSFGGRGSWTKINTSREPLARLLFADFTGNGKTDVFTQFGPAV